MAQLCYFLSLFKVFFKNNFSGVPNYHPPHTFLAKASGMTKLFSSSCRFILGTVISDTQGSKKAWGLLLRTRGCALPHQVRTT